MKKIVLGGVLAVAALTSISANAVTLCTGGVAKNGASVASSTNFVKVSFTPKCSANVFLDGTDSSGTLYVVGAGSRKGKKNFVGSSNGGAVCALTADCAAGGCTAAGVTRATAAEVTAQASNPSRTTCPAT